MQAEPVPTSHLRGYNLVLFHVTDPPIYQVLLQEPE